VYYIYVLNIAQFQTPSSQRLPAVLPIEARREQWGALAKEEEGGGHGGVYDPSYECASGHGKEHRLFYRGELICALRGTAAVERTISREI